MVIVVGDIIRIAIYRNSNPHTIITGAPVDFVSNDLCFQSSGAPTSITAVSGTKTIRIVGSIGENNSSGCLIITPGCISSWRADVQFAGTDFIVIGAKT